MRKRHGLWLPDLIPCYFLLMYEVHTYLSDMCAIISNHGAFWNSCLWYICDSMLQRDLGWNQRRQRRLSTLPVLSFNSTNSNGVL